MEAPADTEWRSGKVHALRLEQNGGYGMGNQEGINYAVSCLEADYVIIANPDIHAPPASIRRVKDALDKTQGAVAASARVKDPIRGENCFLTGPSFLCGRICWIRDWLPGGCLRPC